MDNKIQFKRGARANVPILNIGEPAFTTDTNQFFIGNGISNVELAKQSDLNNVVRSTLGNMAYYVNASSGSDSNNGLSSGTPFKTIQHALDVLPKIINHRVDINISAGTYNERVYIFGFLGCGVMNINGGSSLSSATNYNIIGCDIKNCTCLVNIVGLKPSGATDGFTSFANTYIFFTNCDITNSAMSNSGLIVDRGGACMITSCTISNKAVGILSRHGSIVITDTNGGTGNTTGLQALNGGIIAKAGGQPTGTTPENTNFGGVIR